MTCFYLAFLSVSFFAHIPLKLNLNWLRLACLCLFWNLELFWRNNKTMLNSAFVGYEKFCSSYPNQPHSIVANHSTVADIRGQPFDFWEGWGGMGNLFFPQTSDHIIFFSLTYMYKVIKCQICPWKLFFPMKSVCIYILFPKSPHWKANGWPPSDSLFGHWGTWHLVIEEHGCIMFFSIIPISMV